VDLGESIFRYWLKIKKNRSNKADQDESPSIALKDILDRLHYLGLLLSGHMHQIRGGTQEDEVRDFLIFPDHCSELPSMELNINLLIFRLVFYLTSLETEIRLPAETSYSEQFLFNLLKSDSVLQSMKSTYPGMTQLTEDLYREILAVRPVVTNIKYLPDALEVLAQLRFKGIVHLPEELKAVSGLWKRFGEKNITKKELSEALEALKAVYPIRPGPLPVWLWGFTTNYSPRSETSEFLQVKRREGKEITFELNRTVHIKKWKQSDKDSNPMFHSFEKTESVEDYGGENTSDAIEDMTEDEEAMKDLTLGSVVRTTETTRGLLKADVVDEGVEITVNKKNNDAPGIIYKYPEWDYRSKTHRHDWCTLYESDQPAGPTSKETAARSSKERTREIQEIRTSLLRLLSSREARNRQLDGPEIDYDAVLERYVDVAAGHSPTERLYLTQHKAIKDVSFLVLLDTSLSTDGYVDGRRILDIEIESSLILAGAFEGYLDDEVAIAHFNSRTRNDCRFTYLKRFNRPWATLKRLVGGLEPDGYTRIGPAIRHAAKALAQTKARRKFLLVVSDGKPSDYDQYEGRYGVQDVAQAIREARQQRITTFGLAVEYQTKARLAEMFGSGRYHVLPKCSLLPGYMADIFLRAIS